MAVPALVACGACGFPATGEIAVDYHVLLTLWVEKEEQKEDHKDGQNEDGDVGDARDIEAADRRASQLRGESFQVPEDVAAKLQPDLRSQDWISLRKRIYRCPNPACCAPVRLPHPADGAANTRSPQAWRKPKTGLQPQAAVAFLAQRAEQIDEVLVGPVAALQGLYAMGGRAVPVVRAGSLGWARHEPVLSSPAAWDLLLSGPLGHLEMFRSVDTVAFAAVMERFSQYLVWQPLFEVRLRPQRDVLVL
jgi:hypothetical protein